MVYVLLHTYTQLYIRYSICTNIIPLWGWDSRVFKLKKAERVGESSGVRSEVVRSLDHQTGTKAVEEGGRGVERREEGKEGNRYVGERGNVKGNRRRGVEEERGEGRKWNR